MTWVGFKHAEHGLAALECDSWHEVRAPRTKNLLGYEFYKDRKLLAYVAAANVVGLVVDFGDPPFGETGEGLTS